MPRGRKRAADGAAPGVSGAYLAPGGGTAADIAKLSKELDLPPDAVTAMMNCGGQGVRSSRRSAGGDEAAAAPAVDPAMMNVWGDFMSEEMAAPAPAPAASQPAASSAPKASSGTTAVAASDEAAAGPREYVLPVPPRMRLENGKKASKKGGDEVYEAPAPGLLAQTGTLDASVPGRSALSKTIEPHELMAPHLLFPSVFGKSKIAFLATSPLACHSVAITTDGTAYGWGRNESGQLGLGYASAVVPVPTPLSAGDDDSIKFVGAGVGKYHTILVGSNGLAYASGGNLCGQLGINNQGAARIEKFRKCSVMGQVGGEDEEGEDVKIVQASCGESISALLSSAGHLYTTGSSEFGQLGDGETGEYIVSAGKLGFANCAKFVKRSTFVQSEADAAGGYAGNLMTGKGVDSSGKVKCVGLEDSGTIRLANVACGKHHTVAVEAPTVGQKHVPRVFTWGCGDYGCLGHGIQADEYTPRLVGSMRGPIFASNHPVSAVAGSNCTLVLTKHGHVYYFGKHKQNSEATMRPTLVDALANNGHVVASVGAGNQHVVCTTKNGVTVSWGHGNHGELGFGKDENKSSSKPKFVNGLDSCLVTEVACGMGHTLFIVRNDDAEDAKALKNVPTVEKEDVAAFLESIKGKEVEEDGEPAKKKGRPKK
ncbi:hypothetical protein ACHAXT_005979 [Thalassiosira profunda]